MFKSIAEVVSRTLIMIVCSVATCISAADVVCDKNGGDRMKFPYFDVLLFIIMRNSNAHRFGHATSKKLCLSYYRLSISTTIMTIY